MSWEFETGELFFLARFPAYFLLGSSSSEGEKVLPDPVIFAEDHQEIVEKVDDWADY